MGAGVAEGDLSPISQRPVFQPVCLLFLFFLKAEFSSQAVKEIPSQCFILEHFHVLL